MLPQPRRLNHMSSFVKLRKSLKKLKKRTDCKALDEARYVEIEISSIILRKFHAFILIVLTFLNVVACQHSSPTLAAFASRVFDAS